MVVFFSWFKQEILRKEIQILRKKFQILAGRPRACRSGFSLSQAACEPAEVFFHSRKPLASPLKWFFSLASRLRARRSVFSLSQAACEPAEAFFLSREMEATPQQCGGRSPRETQGVCPRVFILVRGSWRLCGRLSRRPSAP